MPQIFKNMFGAQGAGVEQQRSDLFVVVLKFPDVLNVGGAGISGGINLWEANCGFAVSAFPFPDRSREMLPIKYLNQTNFQIGPDTASGPIAMTVRYAFTQSTAELLEKWHWLTSNPRTGGVALTTAVKTTGKFYWLVPNMDVQANVDDTTGVNSMLRGPSYALEGVLIQNLKPSDANMEQGGLVNLTFGLQIDRYYPEVTSDLTFLIQSGFGGLV